MKQKFANALSLALIVAMLFTSLALADQLSGDTDALAVAAPHANNLTATQNGGTTVAYDLSAYIKETGNATDNVFPGSLIVSIARSGDWLDTDAGSPNSFTFIGYDAGQAGKIRITVPCGMEGTSKTMTALLTAGASTNGKTLNPHTVTLTYVITAGPDDPGCAPSDTTPPTITITTPDEGAVYLLNQVVNADYACADEAGGSGLASCVGTVADGAAIDTSTVGEHTFRVDASDNADNENYEEVTYKVIFDFDGFRQPVDMDGVLNKVKAGQAIPVKFSLNGDQGMGIMAAGYPVSTTTTCGTTTTDTIETTVTAGNSSLSYDALADQYVYVWKTDKNWASSCRTLTVKLIDGTIHQANFQFTK